MSPQRLRFAQAVLTEANGNLTKAAIIAGYSEKTAGQIGSRLFKDPLVRDYINRAQHRAELSTQAALERIGRIAETQPAKGYKGADVLKANELLLKVNGALRDNHHESKVTVNIGYLQQMFQQPNTTSTNAFAVEPDIIELAFTPQSAALIVSPEQDIGRKSQEIPVVDGESVRKP